MKPKHEVSDWLVLPCPRPHLDEIDDVIATLEAERLSVDISDDRHEFTSLAEFIDHRGKTARKLQVVGTGEDEQGYQLHVKVSFEKGFVTLSRRATAESEGVWHRLVGYVGFRRARWYKVAASSFWDFLLPLAMLSSGGILLNPDPLLRKIGWGILAIVATLWGTTTVVKKYGQVIVLERRHSAGFWRRNRDQLVLIFVGALVGSILTALVASLIGP